MKIIKKIQNDCRHATFLIEKKQVQSISLPEELQLRIHLSGCSLCRTFQRQSILINQMVKQHFSISSQSPVLDDSFKTSLKTKIEARLREK